jgi:hypothetical protein
MVSISVCSLEVLDLGGAIYRQLTSIKQPIRAAHRHLGIGPPGRRRRPPLLPDSPRHVEGDPDEVVTDRSPVYPSVLDEVVPAAWHHVERYVNNRVEADHSSGAANQLHVRQSR